MAYTAAVLTISDKGSQGLRIDTSGPALCSMLSDHGWEIVHTEILPDDRNQIRDALISCCNLHKVHLLLTTGGTGFSPRDITPEATLDVVERRTPGITEAMRAESLRITPKGCLSRGEAGIRGSTLIINLPGSEKAARENLAAVLPSLKHGIDMLCSAGSADCAEESAPRKKAPPSMDQWLEEAKHSPNAEKIGMYLTHVGVVRKTPKAQVRSGAPTAKPVSGMAFSWDRGRVDSIIADTYTLPGVYYINTWLNEGTLDVGDDIMRILVGGDIRPHVVDALQYLVGRIKEECVTETELY